MCDVDRGHLERRSSVTVHELSLREDVALVRCHCHVKPCFYFWHKDSLSRVNTLLYTSVSYSLSTFRSETNAVCLTPVVFPTLPPFFHWQAVCLFVVMSLFLFNHSGCFFVSFYRQHASTNATMVFKANCDVHYFHCCLILFGLFSSRIDWQANSPPFFLCCDLCSPLLSFRSLLPSVNLQY